MKPLLILNAQAMDLLTLLIVAGSAGIAGEANPVARYAYAIAGTGGIVALKAGGAGLMAWIVGASQLRLVLAVLAGLAGTMVNVIAWRMVGG